MRFVVDVELRDRHASGEAIADAMLDTLTEGFWSSDLGVESFIECTAIEEPRPYTQWKRSLDELESPFAL